MPHRTSGRWLTGYQKGSIFGAVIVFIAFAAAQSTVPHSQTNPGDQARSTIEAKQPQQEPFWEAVSGGDAVATVTSLLAIVAAIQAVMFIWQLIYMRRGLEKAAAAADAAKAAAEALPQLERAYVFFSYATCDELKNGFGEETTIVRMCKIQYGVKNHGRTPAILDRFSVNFRFVDKRLPERELIKDLPSRLIISAGEDKRDNDQKGPLTRVEYKRAEADDGRIYFWGATAYKDVFGQRHKTGFCAEWNFAQKSVRYNQVR